MVNTELVNRDDVQHLFKKYIANGGILSPFNTNPCREYLQHQLEEHVNQEDVLWLFYHVK